MHDPIPIDFPAEPFDSASRLIVRATRLFLSALPWLTVVTLVVSIPGKLVVQSVLYALDVPPEGIAAYLAAYATDLVWNALLAAAVIYGLAGRLRTGKLPGWRTALGWGRRRWGVMLWNMFKVEITVLLWSLLLIIPGIVATIRLIFTEPIVALDPGAADPLARSRVLTEGRGWRIALALIPMIPLGAAHMYAAFRSLQISPFLMVPVDSVFTILDQWAVAAALLMYLGVAPKLEPATNVARSKASPAARSKASPARTRR